MDPIERLERIERNVAKVIEQRDAALLKIKQLESTAKIFKWGTFAIGMVNGVLLCMAVS